MGKKGVLLDNGKQAQSSMTLYWKRQRENSKKPKREYEPDQEEILEKQTESNFQKWKQYKQKAIHKAFCDKQKPRKLKKQDKQDEQMQIYERQQSVAKSIQIPGFKSKNQLLKKMDNSLNKPIKKQVDQTNNILKLPSNISSLSKQDIGRILREKKEKQRKNASIKQQPKIIQISQDILLGENVNLRKPEQEQQKQEKIEYKQQERFFKSNILNQIAKGNIDIICPKDQHVNASQISKTQKIDIQQNQQELQPKTYKHAFRPRTLGKYN